MGVSCKDLAIGAAFQIYKKIIRKDEECLNKGEEGLEESLNVWAVRAEFPKHGTDEFKKTRKKSASLSLLLDYTIWRPELHGLCVLYFYNVPQFLPSPPRQQLVEFLKQILLRKCETSK